MGLNTVSCKDLLVVVHYVTSLPVSACAVGSRLAIQLVCGYEIDIYLEILVMKNDSFMKKHMSELDSCFENSLGLLPQLKRNIK